jgi:hypothetical protein
MSTGNHKFAGQEGGPCRRSTWQRTQPTLAGGRVMNVEWLPNLKRGQGPPSLPANLRLLKPTQVTE